MFIKPAVQCVLHDCVVHCKSLCFVSIYRSSVRMTDGYIFVPTDKNISRKLQMNREDNPELLPSSKRHVWGRLLTLGSVGIKVSYCIMMIVVLQY